MHSDVKTRLFSQQPRSNAGLFCLRLPGEQTQSACLPVLDGPVAHPLW
ncbi:hypothetical protein GKQ23_00055 (plasmid) [Erwinia sp. E602]|nr:hypothetical protein [Erwinia sp. E602]QUG73480.1 hypothetical protein GKQ23_00055 [Erwinia sp. E602]